MHKENLNPAGSSETIEGAGGGKRKLKRLVAELSLEKQVLKDLAGGSF